MLAATSPPLPDFFTSDDAIMASLHSSGVVSVNPYHLHSARTAATVTAAEDPSPYFLPVFLSSKSLSIRRLYRFMAGFPSSSRTFFTSFVSRAKSSTICIAENTYE